MELNREITVFIDSFISRVKALFFSERGVVDSLSGWRESSTVTAAPRG